MATIPLVYPFVAPVPKLEAQMWWGRHPHRKQTHDRGGGAHRSPTLMRHRHVEVQPPQQDAQHRARLMHEQDRRGLQKELAS